ncbi:hypothetical protein NDU88_002785 [Pleurodeles waltl]|uniref:Uncharacterized protein n=1 Tax=Pleurodeles waltl TaxID=8319 RepID=A0AAV7LDH7_PLEWA|nr:hypothetical protein NDU88_002785 [Pleurodeles waltl]
MACSLASLGGTLAALMGGACDETGLTGTTVLVALVAEVLGPGQPGPRGRTGGGCVRKRGTHRAPPPPLRRQVPFLQEDGPDVGLVAAVEPVDSEEEEAEEEDVDNQNNIIMQYLQ